MCRSWENRLGSQHRKLFALILVLAISITVVLSGSKLLGTPVPNVSAVTAEQNLGVYWDAKCHQSVTQINWGEMGPGQIRDVVVYIRNEGNQTFVLVLTPLNWNPESASRYLSLTLNCEDKKIEAGQVASVTLRLSVSSSITGDYDFGFDMVLEGREFFLGDLNRDGSVDLFDILTLKAALQSTPTDSNWNPKADLNKDSVIGILDLLILRNDIGKSW